MTDACVPYESLERYATGLATDGERQAVESHASRCETCRLTLASVGLAFEPGSVEEEALVAWMASSRPVSALLADLGIPVETQQEPEPVQASTPAPVLRPRRWRAYLGGVAAAAAASLALFFTFLSPSAPAGLELPERALQGRPAQLDGYAPFVALRGGSQDAGWERLEVGLAAERGVGATVALLLSRGGPGDWERARNLLQKSPASAARENDRGVLLLAEGRAAEALRAFERALELDDELISAHFNRALALEALGSEEMARKAWSNYLSLAEGDEAGWLREARDYLTR